LRVPDDASVITVGMTPDPGRPPLPYDAFPLDPGLTCPVAVDLLVRMVDGTVAPAGVTLVPPVQVTRGSVAPVSGRAEVQ